MDDDSLSTVPEGLTTGRLLAGRYRLSHRLASGGMAAVWEGRDEVLDRPVAVKLLFPHLIADKAFVQRFRREAVAAARLSHPHIVPVFDTFSADGVEAIVMQLVQGTTLRAMIDEYGRLPTALAVGITAQAADALEYAHRHGLIHRDVKPANILLTENDRVLVADFGIAKAAEAGSDLTEVGQVVGTAKYLSPEQVEGSPLDPRSDVYSLGVVLYEALSGRAPFDGPTSGATAVARLTTEPLRLRQVRASLPRALEEVVMRAMARHPRDRFQSADELRRALLEVNLAKVDDGDVTVARSKSDAALNPFPTTSPSRVEADGQGAHSPGARGFARSERSWIVPTTIIVIVAATLGLIGALLSRTEVGSDLIAAVTPDEDPPTGSSGQGSDDGDSDEVPLAAVSVSAFDPFGTQGENDGDAINALDGSIDTVWRTERYDTRVLGGLKTGVGLVVALTENGSIEALEIDSPTLDWAVSLYVASEAPTGFDGWGEPVASIESIGGSARFDLDGTEGGALLVWITDLGDGNVGPRFSTAIAEIRVIG